MPFLAFFSTYKYALILIATLSCTGVIYHRGYTSGYDDADSEWVIAQEEANNRWASRLKEAETKNTTVEVEAAKATGILESNHETRKEVIIKRYTGNTVVFDSDELQMVNDSINDPRN